MGLPGCLFVCHLILLLMCFLFNNTINTPAITLCGRQGDGSKTLMCYCIKFCLSK